MCYFLISRIFYPIFNKNILKIQQQRADINSYMTESISAFETIKGLNVENNILKKFNEDILEKYNVTQEMYNLSLDYYINNPKEMEELINYLKHKNTEANVD